MRWYRVVPGLLLTFAMVHWALAQETPRGPAAQLDPAAAALTLADLGDGWVLQSEGGRELLGPAAPEGMNAHLAAYARSGLPLGRGPIVVATAVITIEEQYAAELREVPTDFLLRRFLGGFGQGSFSDVTFFPGATVGDRTDWFTMDWDTGVDEAPAGIMYGAFFWVPNGFAMIVTLGFQGLTTPQDLQRLVELVASRLAPTPIAAATPAPSPTATATITSTPARATATATLPPSPTPRPSPTQRVP